MVDLIYNNGSWPSELSRNRRKTVLGFTGSWSKIYDFPAWISQIGNVAENADLHCNKDAFLSELDGFKPSAAQAFPAW
jgi:hypothetical protein